MQLQLNKLCPAQQREKVRVTDKYVTGCQSFGHFVNGKKLSRQTLNNSAAVQGSCQLSRQHLHQKTELTLHEVCNLSFSPTGPDVFESQARRQKEKKKKELLVSSAKTY